LVENSGTEEISSFNVRVYGDQGVSSVTVHQKLVAGFTENVKMITASYNSDETGDVEKIEISPNIMTKGEEASCSNVKVGVIDFSGCSLSDLQRVACEAADTAIPDTCDKLDEPDGIGLVTRDECCTKSEDDWCCP